MLLWLVLEQKSALKQEQASAVTRKYKSVEMMRVDPCFMKQDHS